MDEKSEEELIREAEALEAELSKKEQPPETKQKAKRLASEVLHHIEAQRQDPIAQRKALVRLAKARPISRLLKESGLIEIREDKRLGRVVIALRADDELVDRMAKSQLRRDLSLP